jgi:hypothetical protein
MLFFSSISVSYAAHDIESPKKQMASGITAEDVQCNVGLQLMLRMNGDAACVKPSTAGKLENAGWGTILGSVVSELPEHDESMELNENISIEEESENEEEEKASYKVELAENMSMGN